MTPAEILRVLEHGELDRLIGAEETSQVEAKGEPYKLTGSESQKQELAKDVSALANASGGIILIGFRTAKNTNSAVEIIDACRPFDPNLVDAQQYRNILQDWVHPPIHSIQIQYYPASSDSNKVVAAILVPEEASAHRPYVVIRCIGPDGRVSGTMIGYYERILDRVAPTSVATLRAHLRDGMRFNEFSERMTGIDAKLERVLSTLGSSESPSTRMVTPAYIGREDLSEEIREKVKKRTAEAIAAVERIGEPNLALTALSTSRCSFPQLFESNHAQIVQLLEHPPVLRREGFAIKAPRASSIIKGELRRSLMPGYEIIDIWNDGALVAVGPGDYELLCWARPLRDGHGLPLRNFVLTEVVYNFVDLALRVFKEAAPAPASLKFFLKMCNMTVGGVPCTLSSERDNIKFPRAGVTRKAPSDVIASEHEAQFEGIDVGRIVYELLAQVYAFFGFNHSEMPYVDEKDPKRITPESMFIKLEP